MLLQAPTVDWARGLVDAGIAVIVLIGCTAFILALLTGKLWTDKRAEGAIAYKDEHIADLKAENAEKDRLITHLQQTNDAQHRDVVRLADEQRGMSQNLIGHLIEVRKND